MQDTSKDTTQPLSRIEAHDIRYVQNRSALMARLTKYMDELNYRKNGSAVHHAMLCFREDEPWTIEEHARQVVAYARALADRVEADFNISTKKS